MKFIDSHAEGKNTDIALTDIPIDFNWNTELHHLSPLPESLPTEPTPEQAASIGILSECLRDGLHGVTTYPTVEDLLSYLEALHDFGIKHAIVGIYPGENNPIGDHTKELLAHMYRRLPTMIPSVLLLCTNEALQWAISCKEIHPGLEVIIFMGSAPSRRLVQQWDMDFVLRKLAFFIEAAVKIGIPVVGGTEHTTQTPPDDLYQILRVHVEHGAYRFIIADTIGTARPRGAYRIVRFVRTTLDAMNAQHVKIDWHGHRDMGNALANSLAAIAAGADYVHVVSRGVGERAGNTALEDVLLNLSTILDEAGKPHPWEISGLLKLISLYEKITNVHTPDYGTLGARFNHTTLGIHTDAIFKANMLAEQALQMRRYDDALKLQRMARMVYSAIDPESIGGKPSVGISQWSGHSSVQLAYLLYGGNPVELSNEQIEFILASARTLGRELEKRELEELFSQIRRQKCSHNY